MTAARHKIGEEHVIIRDDSKTCPQAMHHPGDRIPIQTCHAYRASDYDEQTGRASCTAGHCVRKGDWIPLPARRGPKSPESPSNARTHVIMSDAEYGFFSATQGWVYDVASATRYEPNEPFALIGVADARLIPASDAVDVDADTEWSRRQ